ncbi:MAG: hypothetical protein IJ608_06420 [Lachnospiraceae bacterium]|nr:hypothetical protein [Lachnospiraceae bacterium]
MKDYRISVLIKQKNLVISSVITALLIGFFFVFGAACKKSGMYFETTPIMIMCGFLLSAILFFAVMYAYFFLRRLNIKYASASRERKPLAVKYRIIIFLIMFLAWVPYLLAIYPGAFTYDVTNQFIQHFYGESYSNHHPLVYTIYLTDMIKLGYKLTGDFNIGILFLNLSNMLLGSALFTAVMSYIYRKGVCRAIFYAGVIYYAFFPTIAIFSNCAAKDVFFSYEIILFVYLYMRTADAYDVDIKGRRTILLDVAMAVTTMLMLLGRKNAIYAFVLFVPVQLLLMKKNRIHRLVVLLIGFAGFVAGTVILNAIYEPEPDYTSEKLSVPIQQIARVYVLHGEDEIFDEEQKLLLDSVYLNNFGAYCGINADVVKSGIIDGEMDRRLPDFMKDIWLDIGLKYPTEYINAFILNIYQAFYPFTDITGYQVSGQDMPGSSTCYFQYEVNSPGEFDGKLPIIYDFAENISIHWSLYKIPIVGLLFTVGFHMWLLVFASGYSGYAANKKALSANMMIIFLMFTNFLGPLVLVRYYLVLFYAFPLMLHELNAVSVADEG